MVKGENWTDVEVNTVDGFQGAEKDIIIISSVRSGKQQRECFVFVLAATLLQTSRFEELTLFSLNLSFGTKI